MTIKSKSIEQPLSLIFVFYRLLLTNVLKSNVQRGKYNELRRATNLVPSYPFPLPRLFFPLSYLLADFKSLLK